ncbi:LytTR family transcriptional regulator [Pseudoflavitalea sp. G-6-1-2]|uniref:LytR/AlgR family response regulator transcription factor n=1 Tax=Pseudoflavitalea sp. G-6-1-2 TaxID=2728841 RepID=UPI00146DDA05|nr:LytTR family DNA-binding domain-containing protein [Pseudoflavitalea sp. G-6-1-2]NML21328.1 LytTR family transcriptional regulator [Pseudoflavitalea sp. G-6-1-2]
MNLSHYLRLGATILAGVLIPLLSGLIIPGQFSPASLFATLAFFVLLALVIRTGTKTLHLRMRQQPWVHHQLSKRLLVICSVTILFSVLIAGIMVFVWENLTRVWVNNFSIRIFLANTALAVTIVTLINEMLWMNQQQVHGFLKPGKSLPVEILPPVGVVLEEHLHQSDKQETIAQRRKSRLLLRKGLENIPVRLEEIAIFYTENKVVYALDGNGKKFVSDKKLTELETELDADMFFRANRQYIIALNYIKGFKPYEKVKLQVDLTVPDTPHLVIISQETAPAFRKWVNEA